MPLAGSRVEHLGHVRLDRLGAGRHGDGHPVMAVLHEVQVTDAVHVDGRDRLTTALGERQPLPPLPDPAVGRPEPAVEVPAGIHGPDDRLQPDRLEAEAALALAAQRRDDVVQRQDHVDVVGCPPQSLREPRQRLAAPRAQEVILDIRAGEARVHRHRRPFGATRPARARSRRSHGHGPQPHQAPASHVADRRAASQPNEPERNCRRDARGRAGASWAVVRPPARAAR